MVGALCYVGLGKAPPEAVARALATCARIPKVKSAPAHGLCLARVFYDDEEDAPRALLDAARAADAQHADEEAGGAEEEGKAACAVGTPRSAAAAR
jgi:tRNA U38,U39,U40 pseudouridine synthase TruA